MQKNDIIEVEVTALTHEGNGVARHAGMAVFIPMTAVGDKLLAKVVKVQKSYAFGIVQELLEPSPHRIENDCPVFRQCGGCALRHITYEHEMAVKEDWVVQNMARIGGVRVPFDPPIPSPRPERYRNKAQFPVRLVDGVNRGGFFAGRSHRLVPVENCKLQPAFFKDICEAVLAFMDRFSIPAYNEEEHSGTVRHIYIRWGEATGQVMVCLVINAEKLPHSGELVETLQKSCPQIETVVLSHNTKRTNVITGERTTVLLGEGLVRDVLCDVEVPISPLSFYQVNRQAAELLYRAALEYADPGPEDLLLDMYCGAGTIGLSMAHKVKQVIGVEVVPSAVEDARRAAKAAGFGNARFLCADAAQAAGLLREEGVCPDIVVLDPPRKGAEVALLETVVAMAPEKIVYISCNSATLARDCKELEARGYKVRRARAVDLFPRTAHVEAVALLSKV